MERGLTQHLESLPTPCIAHTINPIATSLRESRLHRRSEISPQRMECGDVSDESEPENTSRGVSLEESKVRETVYTQ